MNRLSELLNNYNNDADLSIEIIDLLVAELNTRAATMKFLGEQLEAARGLVKCAS